MATAITSALTKRPVNRYVAMTGEITLRGRVLPIGGLKEKALAAHRGGINKILFPKDNEKDLEEIPKSIAKEIEWVPVSHMDQVLMHALIWSGQGEDDEQDELFNKLRKITEAELSEGGVSLAH